MTRIRLMEDTIRRHARAFDHISDAVITLDLEARIVDWNPGAERMFGYSKTEMLGKTPDILRPAGATATALDLLATMRREGRWNGEARFVRKDAAKASAPSFSFRSSTISAGSSRRSPCATT